MGPRLSRLSKPEPSPEVALVGVRETPGPEQTDVADGLPVLVREFRP